jgi:type II secretory pathway pseudopilin PulG
MSLPILVAMVVVGISAVVAAVHLSGGSARARLAGADQALQRFATDFPDVTAHSVFLTEDGDTAFLQLDNGAVGIVHGLGDKFLTRIVSSANVADVTARDDRTVSLRLRDFTWKGGNFRFTDSEAAGAVMAAVSGKSDAYGAREKA